MSIKLLAIELYRAQQNVNRLTRQLEEHTSSMVVPVPASLHEELRQALVELQQLRKMFEDKKKTALECSVARFGRNSL